MRYLIKSHATVDTVFYMFTVLSTFLRYDQLTRHNVYNMASGLYHSGTCTYDATLAKRAVNIIAQVYIDECRNMELGISDWRELYDAGILFMN